MSTLTDAFQVRYSAQRVLEWSQPDNPNATTPDLTRLAAAGADAEARFKVEVGVAYDQINSLYTAAALQACIPGVRAFLLFYLDQGAGQKAIDSWIADHLKSLAKVTGRDRLSPATSSRLVPTVEGLRYPTRPSFDGTAFDGVNLDNPSAGAYRDDDRNGDD